MKSWAPSRPWPYSGSTAASSPLTPSTAGRHRPSDPRHRRRLCPCGEGQPPGLLPPPALIAAVDPATRPRAVPTAATTASSAAPPSSPPPSASTSRASPPSPASRPTAAPAARTTDRALVSALHPCAPSDARRRPPTGPSRTSFTGCSTSPSTRRARSRKDNAPQNLALIRNSPSTSPPPPRQGLHQTKSSAPDGTLPSSSPCSPICDSPPLQGRVASSLDMEALHAARPQPVRRERARRLRGDRTEPSGGSGARSARAGLRARTFRQQVPIGSYVADFASLPRGS